MLEPHSDTEVAADEEFFARSPRVAYMPLGVAFLRVLGRYLLTGIGDDPAGLADTIVLLPTRRACRALTETLLDISNGKALILPRLVPLGDLDPDALGEADFWLESVINASLPPSIATLERQAWLTQAILMTSSRKHNPASAWRLASALGALLDEAANHQVALTDLAQFDLVDYAAHWQAILTELEPIVTAWPKQLAAQGAIDPNQRRHLLFTALAKGWRCRLPTRPIIAAGSTGSILATRELLRTIARLPNGLVILPGYDAEVGENDAAALPPTHPQSGLAALIKVIGIERGAITRWDESPPSPEYQARAALLRRAFNPSQIGSVIAGEPPNVSSGHGIIRLDCETPQHEAAVIALLLRETLEHEDKIAALVTPDRGLAARVAAELERYHIVIDDSGGSRLAETPPIVFLRLELAMLAEDFAPVALLALCKHPLAALGLARAECRRLARLLEISIFRSGRIGTGFAGLEAAVEAGNIPEKSELLHFIARLKQATAPLAAIIKKKNPNAAEWLAAHLASAENLAAREGSPGSETIWQSDAGEAAATLLQELLSHIGELGPMNLVDYSALFESWIENAVHRPRFGRHPRLFIWGPLEARLQTVDRIILGGLNEGTWPAIPAPDPWLSPIIRKTLGLPSPEQRIGQAAHDFTSAFGAPEAILTRAKRVDRAPALPSRWLERLELLAGVTADPNSLWLGYAAALDHAMPTPQSLRPIRKPPVNARPRHASVSDMRLWQKDAYAFYAKRILALKPLQPIAPLLNRGDRGTLLHHVFEQFTKSTAIPSSLNDQKRRLDEILQLACQARHLPPEIILLWRTRINKIFAWFLREDARRRDTSRQIWSELTGCIVLHRPGGAFTLTAKADRIELDPVSGLTLIDYKTGTAPTCKAIETGTEPQLLIEAMIAMHGGFAGVGAHDIARLEIWHLSGTAENGKIIHNQKTVSSLCESYQANLEALIDQFDDPETPYIASCNSKAAPDYAHLARRKEWGFV